MRFLGGILIFSSLAILAYVFGPVIKEETRYGLDQISRVKYVVDEDPLNSFEKKLTPVNEDFSIIIPKIAAVAPIVEGVNPNEKDIYLKALKKGVAHAVGSARPGEIGNVYLFAHSTDAFYNVNTYNAVFYLIGKLERNDEIYIYYQGRKIKYIVDYKKVVKPEDIKYLGILNDDSKTLTLQTCYPPGTTLNRLVVVANLVKE